jgi:uncharacterized protein (AIM24 family)
MHRNSAMNALLGGEGLFQTMVRGQGKVVLRAQGTVQTVVVDGDTMAVDGNFAVAREATLDYQVRRATKSLVGSVTSGEGLLQFFSGRGRVLLAPVPDLQQAIIDQVRAPQVLQQAAPSAGGAAAGLIGVLVMVVLMVVFTIISLVVAMSV